MNNKDKKKGNTAKLQVMISVMMLAIILFTEIYMMINIKNAYMEMVSLVLVALVMIYFLVDAVMALSAERETKREEHYENIFRSEKASYILLKKSFDEIEERLIFLQENQQMPAQEIINAQKGISKVIISRSQENADVILNSNTQVLARLDEAEEKQNLTYTNFSTEYSSKLSELSTQMNSMDCVIQDLLLALKDMELRLNQAIMSGTKVVYSAAPVYENTAAPVIEEPVMEEPMTTESVAEEPVMEESVIVESEEEPVMEEPVIAEPKVEKAPVAATPEMDMSDPNKMMSADDIAALFASMGEDTSAASVIEEPVVEEKPAMPDMSDPNKMMSPDDIAALLANMGGNEPAAVAEEPVVEEAPVAAAPEIDMSDPNKMMSADDIAALFASMGMDSE